MKWVCKDCGSDKLEQLAYVNINTDKINDYQDDAVVHCCECMGANTHIKTKKERNEMIKRMDEKPPSLKYMQQYVGGLIQIIDLSDGRQIIINDEGKLKELPYNKEATEIANKDGALFSGDFIVGNAIVLSGKGLLK